MAQTYRGAPRAYTLIFCYANLPGGLTYEVIEPISGPTIFQKFLDEKGEGLNHVAYDYNGLAMAEKVAGFRERGWEMVQSGLWRGGGEFMFFENKVRTAPYQLLCFAAWGFLEVEIKRGR